MRARGSRCEKHKAQILQPSYTPASFTTMALRFDRGSLASPQVLNDGTLRVDAVITRAGVFTYRPNGLTTTKEYRPPEEVFRADSMNSFVGMAVLDDHPYDQGGLVTLENRKSLEKGFIQSVRRDGNDLVATLIITDPGMISKLKAGKTACSCGYTQDIVNESGVSPEGERYDAMQTNIRGNHVAIVDVARAGEVARVRMDSAHMIAGETARSNVMDLTQALAALALANVKIGELNARADSAEKERDALRTRTDAAEKKASTAEAERDAAKEKAEKAEKARLDAETGSMERAKERVSLEAIASKHLRNDAGEPLDVSKKSNHEVKMMLVEKLTGKKMEGKTEAYIAARYDAALESANEADATLADVRNVSEIQTRNDGGTPSANAREEMIKRNHTASIKKGN